MLGIAEIPSLLGSGEPLQVAGALHRLAVDASLAKTLQRQLGPGAWPVVVQRIINAALLHEGHRHYAILALGRAAEAVFADETKGDAAANTPLERLVLGTLTSIWRDSLLPDPDAGATGVAVAVRLERRFYLQRIDELRIDVALVRVLGAVAALPRFRTLSAFMTLVDALLPAALAPHAHPLLQAEALRAVARALEPGRPADVARIERLYRPLVDAVAPRDADNAGATHPLVVRALALFDATWPTMPTRAALEALSGNSEALARVPAGSWAARRVRGLLDGTGAGPLDLELQGSPAPTDGSLVRLCAGALFVSWVTARRKGPRQDSEAAERRLGLVQEALATPRETDRQVGGITSSLTFTNGRTPILLANAPLQRDVHLQNTLLDAPAPFTLQTWPPGAFQAVPSRGSVAPGASVTITVSTGARRWGEADGVLLVRDSQGLVADIVRLGRAATPSLRVGAETVNVGFCPVGETRTVALVLSNGSTVQDVSCALALLGASSGAVQLLATDATVTAGGEVRIGVRVRPLEEHAELDLVETIVIVEATGAVTRVCVRAFAGSALELVSADRLDFGALDNVYGGATKAVMLKNRDAENALPVAIDCSTHELAVRTATFPLVIPPLGLAKVPVTFTNALTGVRNESVTFAAPCSQPIVIGAASAPGVAVSLPIAPRIAFPTALIGGPPVAVTVPLVNQLDTLVQVRVALPGNVPFEARALDTEACGRKAMMGAIEVEPFASDDEGQGLIVRLGPRATVGVQLVFGPAAAGVFAARVVVEQNRPRVAPVGELHLVAAAVGPGADSARVLDELESKTRGRSTVVTAGNAPFAAGTTVPQAWTHRPGGALEAHAAFLVVPSGPASGGIAAARYAIVYNKGATETGYRLAVSGPFTTDVAVSGVLPPQAALEVGIRLGPFSDSALELRSATVLGALTIVADSGEVLSIPLYGVHGEAVDVDVRAGTGSVRFAAVPAHQGSARRFVFRNKLPVESAVECKFATLRVPGDASGANAGGERHVVIVAGTAASDECAFRMATTKFVLRPYEHLPADIVFNGPDPGRYVARVVLETADAAPRYASGALQLGSVKRAARVLELVGHALGNYVMFDGESLFVGTGSDAQVAFEATSALDETQTFAFATRPFKVEGLHALGGRVKGTLNVTIDQLSTGSANDNAAVFGALVVGDCYAQQLLPLTAARLAPLSLELSLGGERRPVGDVCEVDLGLSNAYSAAPLRVSLVNAGGCAVEVTQVGPAVPARLFQASVSAGAVFQGCEDAPADILALQRTRFTAESARVEPWNVAHLALVGAPGGAARLGEQRVQIPIELAGGDSFELDARANMQPPLQVRSADLDVGIRPFCVPTARLVEFANIGTVPLPWHLTMDRALDGTLTATPKFTLEVFPSAGTLAPNETQKVLVQVRPTAPEKRLEAALTLHTAGYAKQSLQLQGTSAWSRLVVSDAELDFGVLRVGTAAVRRTILRNAGALAARFHVETRGGTAEFTCDPEEGILEGEHAVELVVRCCPRRPGRSVARLAIAWTAAGLPAGLPRRPLSVALRMAASYPELVVHTQAVDFGIALLDSDNRQLLSVENKGDAEAVVELHSHHGGLRLGASTRPDGAHVVAARSTAELPLVFRPTAVERLDTHVFVRLQGSRGEYFGVRVRGTVGVPQLVVEPAMALERMDFGVCRVHGRYQRRFTLANRGNISLTWSLEFDAAASSERVLSLPTALFELVGRSGGTFGANRAFVAEPDHGVLACGDEIGVTLWFSPGALAAYEAPAVLRYEFFTRPFTARGSGGLAYLVRDAAASPAPAGGTTPTSGGADVVDFGVCRTHVTTVKHVALRNLGNLDARFYARWLPVVSPGGEAAAWRAVEQHVRRLQQSSTNPPNDPLGKNALQLANPNGVVPAASRALLRLELAAEQPTTVSETLRIYHDHGFEQLAVRGSTALRRLVVQDDSGTTLWPGPSAGAVEVSLGTHALGRRHTRTFRLVNMGPFAIEYLVQPTGIREFEVGPLQGTIPAHGRSRALHVTFCPASDAKVQSLIKVLWEHAEPVQLLFTGLGGAGRYAVAYADANDAAARSIDFGMVPFQVPVERRVAVVNQGPVDLDVDASVLPAGSDDFSLSVLGAPFALGTQPEAAVRAVFAKPRRAMAWQGSAKIGLPVGHAVELGCRFLTSSANAVAGTLQLASPAATLPIPLRGRGGRIELHHEGSLDLGDISSNFTYTRKVRLLNRGTIPAALTFEWLVVGHAGEAGAQVSLAEQFTAQDPRSGWARREIGPIKGARGYWAMVRLVVAPPGAQAHAKQRQMLFALVSSKPASSQTPSATQPSLSVSPASAVLGAFGAVDLTVTVHLGAEDTFLATLVCRPTALALPAYELPLTATPKLTNVVCDEAAFLDFGRQPIGYATTLTRTFTNRGSRDFSWTIRNSNAALVANPLRGFLPVGASVTIAFTFTPSEETPQTQRVLFAPECAQPVGLGMFGGGGIPKCSLNKYRRFDFGPCMVGKDTCSLLPVTNDGTASIHFSEFTVHESDTYFKGVQWPSPPLALAPGRKLELPIVFHPRNDAPPTGRLTVRTAGETFDIELVGQGREAVLILSRQALEFSECLIGNTYEQTLRLRNVGDVNYPVAFELDRAAAAAVRGDVEFTPPNMVIPPFSETAVIVSFTPSSETRTFVQMLITSPYSSHTVPISLHSGTATLQFEQDALDFGLFEKTSHPRLPLTIRNAGTIKTTYAVRDTVHPRMFTFENGTGTLLPGKSVTVTVIHMREHVCVFDETLRVRSDVVDHFDSIPVRGQCEEAVVHQDEVAELNLGICPVAAVTTRSLPLHNYGRFPLSFQLKFAYPLKASPASGQVAGAAAETLTVQWSPSGAYELRSAVQICTNIGEFTLLVRGKGAFPEIALGATLLDLGVCPIGLVTRVPLPIHNTGKVPLQWSVAAGLKDPWTVDPPSGSLRVRESTVAHVCITPAAARRYAATLLVECRGVPAKEVQLVATGGVLALEIAPQRLDAGECPCDLQVFREIVLRNAGDMALSVAWVVRGDPSAEGVALAVPETVTVPPGQTARVVVGITASTTDAFAATVCAIARDVEFPLQVVGQGVRIRLGTRIVDTLRNEDLPCIRRVGPLDLEMTADEWAVGAVGPTELDRLLQIAQPSLQRGLALVAALAQAVAAYADRFGVRPAPTSAAAPALAGSLAISAGPITAKVSKLQLCCETAAEADAPGLAADLQAAIDAAEAAAAAAACALTGSLPVNLCCTGDGVFPGARDPWIHWITAVSPNSAVPPHVSVVPLLVPEIPDVFDPAASVLDRPPPFPTVNLQRHHDALERQSQAAAAARAAVQRSRHWAQHPPVLERRLRNARATGVWARRYPE